MKKRGQVAFFIILGIILVIGVIALVLYQSQKAEEIYELKIPTVTYEKEVLPIVEYVQGCMEITAEDAVNLMGKQGGYVYPDDYGISANFVNPTESDSVLYVEDSFKVPYWYYMSASNVCTENCRFDFNRPPLVSSNDPKSMELQLKKYFDSKLNECLDNLKIFEDQFDSIEAKKPESVVNIATEDLRIKLAYPVVAKQGDKEYELEEFYVQMPVNLRKAYELASVITNAEIRYKFLERMTMNVVTSYARVDEDALPPIADTEFNSGGGNYWVKTVAEQNVMDLIVQHIPLFQVPGTFNYIERTFRDDIARGLYGLFDLPIFSPSKQSYEDVSVRFKYLSWWNPYFDIKGRGINGALIGPESIATNIIAVMGFNRYNYYYDISYPVIVEIYDQSAFNGQGYSFNFALEANIRRNKAVREDYKELDVVPYVGGSLLCNPNQKNSGTIEVDVADGISGEGVDDAQILFNCGAETCYIGNTEDGIYSGNLPLCLGGEVVVSKEGYVTNTAPITTLYDKDDELELTLEPLRTMQVDVKKRVMLKGLEGWELRADPKSLLDKEWALLLLEKVTDNPNEEYSTAIKYTSDLEDKTLQLVPGIYKVDLTLIMELPAYGVNEIVIAEQEKEAGPFWNKEEYTIPEIKFEKYFMEGGAVLNEETGYLEITKEMLDNNDKITFYAISSTDFNSRKMLSHEDLDRFGDLTRFSLAHNEYIQPDFSKESKE